MSKLWNALNRNESIITKLRDNKGLYFLDIMKDDKAIILEKKDNIITIKLDSNNQEIELNQDDIEVIKQFLS